MKYLDTYETWDKIFKLVIINDDLFKVYIHDNCWLSPSMQTISFNQVELAGLAEFIQNFLRMENEK